MCGWYKLITFVLYHLLHLIKPITAFWVWRLKYELSHPLFFLFFFCGNRSLVQNENGFAHCFPPSIAGTEFEGKTLPVNQMRTSMEVDFGKTDKTNFGKVLYKHELVYVCALLAYKRNYWAILACMYAFSFLHFETTVWFMYLHCLLLGFSWYWFHLL